MKGWAIAAVLAVAGCGGDSGGGGGGGDMGPVVEQCNADGKAESLNGRVARRADRLVHGQVVAGCTGSACMVDNDAASELLLLADIPQPGRMARATVRPCKIIIPPVALKNQPMPVQITVPTA